MKCFHHNDADGRCAAAIVEKNFRVQTNDLIREYIEIDYKDNYDFNLIKPQETVFVVDFSFKPDDMCQILKRTKEVTWIDHHQTAKDYRYYIRENGEEAKYIRLSGVRDFENKYSGCELAWRYYFLRDRPMPESVMFIGDRDTWQWKYGKNTANFCQGLKLYAHGPKDEIWDKILDTTPAATNEIAGIREKGEICLNYRDMICDDYCKGYGFECDFEGHSCFAQGIYMFGSEAFGARVDKYEICLSIEFDGKKWTVGLYSKNIDVSKIAKKYGGGGHKGAAGFVCDKLPFAGA